MARSFHVESLEERQLLTITSLGGLGESYRHAQLFDFVERDGEAHFMSGLNADFQFSQFVSDGTAEGTRISDAQLGIPIGDSVIYTVLSTSASGERTNALFVQPPAGAEPIQLTPVDVSVAEITPYGDGVAFIDITHHQIWLSDGTPDGTRAVTDPKPELGSEFDAAIGISLYDTYSLIESDGALYVSSVVKTEFWRWDGSSRELELVHNFSDGDRFENSDVRHIGDKLWIRVTGQYDSQLWTLGITTEAPTQPTLVFDWDEAFVSWNDLTVSDDLLMFTASSGRGPDGQPYPILEVDFNQLWVTDGTTEGTVSLQEPGWQTIVSTAATPTSLFHILKADDGNFELWQSDRDLGQSRKVHHFDRIVLQGGSSLATIGEHVYFVDGSDLPRGAQTLYGYDASAEAVEPQSIKEFTGGVTSSLHQLGNSLLFAADYEEQLNLWRSDGTSAGTQPIQEIDSVRSASRIRLHPLDDRLVFQTLNFRDLEFLTSDLWSLSVNGDLELLVETGGLANLKLGPGEPIGPGFNGEASPFVSTWSTDGTRAGTRLVSHAEQSSSDAQFAATQQETGVLFQSDPITLHGSTYFVRNTPELGAELWVTSESGETRLVKDILPGPFSSTPRDLTVINDVIYFSARDRTTIYRFGDIEEEHEENWELWRSDGTTEGTYKLAELNPAPEAFPASTSSSEPGGFMETGDGFLFNAIYDGFERYLGNGGRGWFFSDGTTEGTQRITELDQGIRIGLFGGQSYFADAGGIEYFDDTTREVVLVQQFENPDDIEQVRLIWTGNRARRDTLPSDEAYLVLLRGDDAESTVWRTDGTADGTFAIGNIPDVKSISQLSLVDDKYFLHVRTDDGTALWVIEDRESRLVQAAEDGVSMSIIPLTPGVNVNSTATGETVQIRSDQIGYRLQETDCSDPANCQTVRSEAWITDGTPDGTFLFGDPELLQPGRNVLQGVNEWEVVEDVVYFTVDENEEFGDELWRTDGTKEGTFVYDIAPGEESSNARIGPQWRGELYFTTSSGGIWRTGDNEVTADVNDDKLVDFADFLAVSHNFGQAAERADGDVNEDGTVDFADFLAVSFEFGQRELPDAETLEPIQQDVENIEAIYAAIMEQDAIA